MKNTNIKFDINKGVDLMRGNKVVEHFDGENALTLAKSHERDGRGLYIRYWAAKSEEQA